MIPQLSEGVIVGVFTFGGAVVSALAAIAIARRTSKDAEQAGKRSDVIEEDKFGLAELKEIAIQNRADRQEWRQERTDMRARLDNLESQVQQLRLERQKDAQQIEQLRGQIAEHETLRQQFTRYVVQLREFIVSFGQKPPAPDTNLPIPLDTTS